ncbi:NUDIX domain-containing protein [Luteococcus peritonei]|uniref:NUDIX domain-containing protein n=1 Tax=Luteococcus peritonei TaxID=88874 RepID=A0ABW4RV96_9ACTN
MSREKREDRPDRAAAVLLDEGRVLLIRRTKPGEDYLVVPGGKVEPGESPEQACRREVLEEVNLTVEVGELLDDFRDEGRTQFFFRVRRTGGRVRLGDGPERARAGAENGYEPVWVPVSELDEHELRPREARRIIERAAGD